MELIHTL